MSGGITIDTLSSTGNNTITGYYHALSAAETASLSDVSGYTVLNVYITFYDLYYYSSTANTFSGTNPNFQSYYYYTDSSGNVISSVSGTATFACNQQAVGYKTGSTLTPNTIIPFNTVTYVPTISTEGQYGTFCFPLVKIPTSYYNTPQYVYFGYQITNNGNTSSYVLALSNMSTFSLHLFDNLSNNYSLPIATISSISYIGIDGTTQNGSTGTFATITPTANITTSQMLNYTKNDMNTNGSNFSAAIFTATSCATYSTTATFYGFGVASSTSTTTGVLYVSTISAGIIVPYMTFSISGIKGNFTIQAYGTSVDTINGTINTTGIGGSGTYALSTGTSTFTAFTAVSITGTPPTLSNNKVYQLTITPSSVTGSITLGMLLNTNTFTSNPTGTPSVPNTSGLTEGSVISNIVSASAGTYLITGNSNSIAAGSSVQMWGTGAVLTQSYTIFTTGTYVTSTTGYISGTTLTITGSTSGITVRQTIVGYGINFSSSTTQSVTNYTSIAQGTIIRNGSGSSWTINTSQNIGNSTYPITIYFYYATYITSTTASISGTNLTITGSTSNVAIGQYIYGPSVIANTYITAGSGTSWTVNNSQAIASTTLYFYPNNWILSGNGRYILAGSSSYGSDSFNPGYYFSSNGSTSSYYYDINSTPIILSFDKLSTYSKPGLISTLTASFTGTIALNTNGNGTLTISSFTTLNSSTKLIFPTGLVLQGMLVKDLSGNPYGYIISQGSLQSIISGYISGSTLTFIVSKIVSSSPAINQYIGISVSSTGSYSTTSVVIGTYITSTPALVSGSTTTYTCNISLSQTVGSSTSAVTFNLYSTTSTYTTNTLYPTVYTLSGSSVTTTSTSFTGTFSVSPASSSSNTAASTTISAYVSSGTNSFTNPSSQVKIYSTSIPTHPCGNYNGNIQIFASAPMFIGQNPNISEPVSIGINSSASACGINNNNNTTTARGANLGFLFDNVAFYSCGDDTQQNPVVKETLDVFGGHPNSDAYHHHYVYPSLYNWVVDYNFRVIGFMADGYPIITPFLVSDNKTGLKRIIAPQDLNQNNGMPCNISFNFVYQGTTQYYQFNFCYVATNCFPYTIGSLYGTPNYVYYSS